MSTAALPRPTGDREGAARWRPEWERFLSDRPSREATWLGRLRRSAFARFEELGLPTTRLESFRSTSLAPLARTTFRVAAGEPREVGRDDLARLTFHRAFESHQVVFVDGRHAPGLSGVEGTPGLRVLSLRELLAADGRTLEALLDRLLPADAPACASLNTAFLEDGAVVLVEPGRVVEAPVHVVFYSTGTGPATPVSHPRLLVRLGRGSRLTLVESHGGAPGAAYLANAVTEVFLDDGAVLDHCRVQRESEAAIHLSTTAVRQGRDSRFTALGLDLGGALVRHDVDQAFGGEGGECTLDGLFLVDGERHVDSHTRIDHAVPRCSSRETYKGVLDGKGRGVFHGTVLVRPGAQKTDAWQVNRNLLLSDEALVDSTPTLLIHADDVRCKHGSTTGQIDAAQLFYLRSRGIGEAEARSLLVHAFASDLLRRVAVEPLRAGLEEHVRRRLPGGPGDTKEARV